MKKYSLCLCLSVLLLLLVSCSKRNLPGASEYDSNLYSHTVKHYGENLSVIALWYSGSAKVAEELLRYNPTLRSKTLKVGTKVQIPSGLMKRRTPLPKDFVREALQSKPRKSKQRAPQAAEPSPTPTPEITLQTPSTTVITNSPESAARRRKVLQELLEE